MNAKVRRFVSEPLVHFLLIGALLFAVSGFIDQPATQGQNRIVVTPGQVDSLVEAWTKAWNRPPTPDELSGLVRDHVKEEVFYREALAMGLEKDDTIIRRRLRQKMEFLGESLVAEVEPTDSDLAQWFAANKERFRSDRILTIDQILFSEDQRGANAENDARRVLDQLRKGATTVDENPGDSVMLPARLERTSSREVEATFGADFAEAIANLPVGEWSGPLRSGFGLHLVRIEAMSGGDVPKLSEILEDVRRDYMDRQRLTMNDRLYTELLKRYKVTVELPDWAGGGTVAMQ